MRRDAILHYYPSKLTRVPCKIATCLSQAMPCVSRISIPNLKSTWDSVKTEILFILHFSNTILSLLNFTSPIKRGQPPQVWLSNYWVIYYFWLYSPTDLSIGVLPGEQSPALAGTQFETDLGDRSNREANPISEIANPIFCRTLFCRWIENQGPLLLQLPELLARSAQGVGGGQVMMSHASLYYYP